MLRAISELGQGRLSSRVDDTAGLPSAPELLCAPSQLRLAPTAVVTTGAISVHGFDVWMARSDCSPGTRIFQMSECMEQEEETGGRHPCARKAGDEAAGRRGLFHEDQDR